MSIMVNFSNGKNTWEILMQIYENYGCKSFNGRVSMKFMF